MGKSRLLAALCLWTGLAGAAGPQQLLQDLEAEARRGNSAFKAFSPARGEQFFRTERSGSDGARLSCASCHTGDPRASGKTRANKEILPLAPSANRERFTDRAKVDKWFRRNCNDVLGRGEEGSGLGLSIVKRVADLHRATVELAEGPGGRGLKVCVAFPAVQA